MKKVLLVLVLLSFIFVRNTCFATTDELLENWSFTKDIAVSGNDLYASFYLDKDVYKNANSDLSDLRIVNEEGKFVPYYIVKANEDMKLHESYYASNKIFEFEKDNATYFDYKIVKTDNNLDVLGSSLRFTISTENFMKNIDIYGSFDGVEWDYIQSDKIYKIDNIIKEEVFLKDILRYEYYRIKIPNNLEAVSIKDLKLLYSKYALSKNTFEGKTRLSYSIETKDSQTTIKINNDSRLSIIDIYLSIKENFNRQYLVQSVISESSNNLISSGNIYNMQFKELSAVNTSISLINRPIKEQAFEIVILNKDDVELTIDNIEFTYQIDKIVFDSSKGNSFKLYFGNINSEKSPQYDIETYKTHIEGEAQGFCVLGDITELTSYNKEDRNSELNMKPIFNILLVIVSLILIIIILCRLKKTRDF